MNFLFEIVYITAKVRGEKHVVRTFPHDVNDLEYIVEVLHFVPKAGQWWIPYVLFLWLSIVVLAPFDLETMDSRKYEEELVPRITNLCKECLNNTGKLRDAAALVLSKLVTRPDLVKKGLLTDTLAWLRDEYTTKLTEFNQVFYLTGLLYAVYCIFKYGHRTELLPQIEPVFSVLFAEEKGNKEYIGNTILTKLKVKLAQRIGLIYLKPKVAKWRYERGFRSLADNLLKAGGEEVKGGATTAPPGEEEEEEDDEEANMERLEEILALLT